VHEPFETILAQPKQKRPQCQWQLPAGLLVFKNTHEPALGEVILHQQLLPVLSFAAAAAA
jgi:hypothetical protein